jgi:ribose transport system ATP-binding protein
MSATDPFPAETSLAAGGAATLPWGSRARGTVGLSGGNQRKVVIARSLSVGPLVILLDDPTRGVDVGAKAEVHQILNGMTRQGRGVLLVSSELPEVLAMSDRVLAMYGGRVIAERPHGADHEAVMQLITGVDAA